MLERRGKATKTTENNEYPAQMPLACTKYLQHTKSRAQSIHFSSSEKQSQFNFYLAKYKTKSLSFQFPSVSSQITRTSAQIRKRYLQIYSE